MTEMNKNYLKSILTSAGVTETSTDVVLDAVQAIVAAEVQSAKTNMAQQILRDIYAK